MINKKFNEKANVIMRPETKRRKKNMNNNKKMYK